MKKSKYRNNYSNQGYSLNFKFDSVSPAGKFSGTALDLIKRYNDLAKESHSNGNYVEAEVFRQYAEHYRKIVTEINERKQHNEVKENTAPVNNNQDAETDKQSEPQNIASTQIQETTSSLEDEHKASSYVETKAKKTFKVIEITDDKKAAKPQRNCKSRAKKSSEITVNE